jgi:hypothetical protein
MLLKAQLICQQVKEQPGGVWSLFFRADEGHPDNQVWAESIAGLNLTMNANQSAAEKFVEGQSYTMNIDLPEG